MTLRILPLLTSFVAALITTSASAQNTSAVGASEDAFVSSGFANRNFGGAGALYASGPDTQAGDTQTLLKFDFASTKAQFDSDFGAGNWTVQSAVLDLTSAGGGNPFFADDFSGNFSISWMANTTWVEGIGTPNIISGAGITYNTLPDFLSPADEALGAFSFDTSGGGDGTHLQYSLNIGFGLGLDILDGGTSSIRLYATSQDLSYLTYGRIFASVPGYTPLLTITAAPIPEPSAAAALAGIAAMGCLIWRHRK